MEKKEFDLIVIGGGVAGASGAMYASRLGLKTAMIAEMPGGLITTTHLVENWPGQKSISGPDLAMSLIDHATSFGVPLINENVIAVQKTLQESPSETQKYLVKTSVGEYLAKTVLFATGTKHKKMGVPGEVELANKGVSYCALCDGGFYRGKVVCIVGGGDSAAKEALLLAELCEKVFLFVRGDKLRAEPINIDRVKNNNKIEVRFGTQITEIQGNGKVEKVILNNGEEINLAGVFVAIGHMALSDLARDLGVEINEKNEIIINRRSETSLPGVFAAGDVTDTEFKQAITGSAEAVTAAYYAADFVGKNY
jgi:thioredoxin reductase (NADPH)